MLPGALYKRWSGAVLTLLKITCWSETCCFKPVVIRVEEEDLFWVCVSFAETTIKTFLDWRWEPSWEPHLFDCSFSHFFQARMPGFLCCFRKFKGTSDHTQGSPLCFNTILLVISFVYLWFNFVVAVYSIVKCCSTTFLCPFCKGWGIFPPVPILILSRWSDLLEENALSTLVLNVKPTQFKSLVFLWIEFN